MAGAAIAREAGAQLLDVNGSDHTPNSRGTIAVSPGIANPLLDLIRQAVQG
jgi:myo-inositol-1(or 4)-monophosphatase